MDQTSKDVLRLIMDEYSSISYIKPEDIPDIPLYMDQITSFMDSKLENCKRHPDDKILTKTMINNYTKNKLIPPPDKKKYSKDHLLLLIYVYYLKDFLSISDIQTLMEPLEKDYFQTDSNLSMLDIYENAVDLVKGQIEYMTKDLMRRYRAAHDSFADSEEDPYLILFAFIVLMSFDVYVKKHLIESVVDEMNHLKENEKHDNKEKKQK